MKHLKLFESFSTPKPLTKRQINWLDKCAGGGWSLNPSTGLVDVDGNFDCISQRLKDFKGVAFGHVKGNFSCRDNQLTSLIGAPQTVDGGFNCVSNQLTSLVDAPQTVGGYFGCSFNQLTSLEGAPQTVGEGFFCGSNPVSERTLESIFSLMKNGKSYQQALKEYWPDMSNEDRSLMYKDHSSLAQEEIRRYDALATVNRIKNYL